MSDKYSSINQNVISRLQHCVAKAIQEEILLPKFMVFVIDNDFISSIDSDAEEGLTKPLGRLADAIMRECDCLIEIQKDYLPKKVKKPSYPQIIWIEPPLHKNFTDNQERKKFIRAINDVSKFHENIDVLKLKKVWDTENNNLYHSYYRRFMNEGFSTYWRAIDATLKFADTILYKKKHSKDKTGTVFQTSSSSQQAKRRTSDKYHWR